jgi:hypothetical protein
VGLAAREHADDGEGGDRGCEQRGRRPSSPATGFCDDDRVATQHFTRLRTLIETGLAINTELSTDGSTGTSLVAEVPLP